LQDRNRTNANSEQQDHRQHEPAIRTPSVELPLFHGENAAHWILECEGIFELSGITNDSKIKWANAHIRGKAKTWLASAELQLQSPSWQQLCTLLSERFPPPLADDSIEQCQVLKQLNTVDNYID
jgi:hypothetical protein